MSVLPSGAASDAWRRLAPAALERAYTPSSCIGGDYRPYLVAYAERSAAARAAHPHREWAYGAAPRQRLDLFMPAVAPGAARPALVVFIHGGYWQELSKAESSFAAADALRQGIAYAALDYTLAPAATLAEIVAECRSAVAWLLQRAEALGFDAQRVVVAGSSAGAHLAAMVGLALPVKALVLVSGIYELEPLLGTSVNHALGLDVPQAREHSPLLQPLAGLPPALVCWGEIETDEFKRQGRQFADALASAGRPCRRLEIAGRNHFDVILDLMDPATPLGHALLAWLGPAPAGPPPA